MQPADFSGALSPWTPGVFSLAVYTVAVFVLLALLTAASSFIGSRRPSEDKLRPYESGIIPTGSARLRYPVPFYLVAIFFLIFDVEGAFIFSWAISARELGWAGWFQMTFFIVVLLLGLVYIWKKGGLEWGPTRKDNRTTGS
jgi:NADH-quinone oxidoreductase subunit A